MLSNNANDQDSENIPTLYGKSEEGMGKAQENIRKEYFDPKSGSSPDPIFPQKLFGASHRPMHGRPKGKVNDHVDALVLRNYSTVQCL